MNPMNQDIVDSLNELLAGINRKIGLAKTSAAYFKGTNKETIAKLLRQQHALLTAINRMD